jgi:hypothetical protein
LTLSAQVREFCSWDEHEDSHSRRLRPDSLLMIK